MISKPYTSSVWSALSFFINRGINWGSHKSTHFHIVMGRAGEFGAVIQIQGYLTEKSTFYSWCHDACDRGSLFHIIISLIKPFYSKDSISAVDSCDMKGDKRVTC